MDNILKKFITILWYSFLSGTAFVVTSSFVILFFGWVKEILLPAARTLMMS